MLREHGAVFFQALGFKNYVMASSTLMILLASDKDDIIFYIFLRNI